MLRQKPELLRDQIGKERDTFAVPTCVGTFGVDYLSKGSSNVVQIVLIND